MSNGRTNSIDEKVKGKRQRRSWLAGQSENLCGSVCVVDKSSLKKVIYMMLREILILNGWQLLQCVDLFVYRTLFTFPSFSEAEVIIVG